MVHRGKRDADRQHQHEKAHGEDDAGHDHGQHDESQRCALTGQSIPRQCPRPDGRKRRRHERNRQRKPQAVAERFEQSRRGWNPRVPLQREFLQGQHHLHAVVEGKDRQHQGRDVEEQQVEHHVDVQYAEAPPLAGSRCPRRRRGLHLAPPDGSQLREPYERDDDDDDGDDHEDRQRRAQRPVVGRAELGRDDLAEHHAPRTADHHRGDVVANRGDELDDGGDDDAGHRQRQRDPEESPRGTLAEVGRRFQKGAVDFRERHVDGQDGKGGPRVGEGEDHGESAVQQLVRTGDYAEVHERGVDDAVVAQNDLPREHPQQVARQERQADQDQPRELVLPDLERQEIGDRIRQQHGDERHRRRHPDRPQQQLAVDPLVEKRLVVAERERLDRVHVLLGPEAVDDKGEDRQRERADHERERWRQLRVAAQPLVSEEECPHRRRRVGNLVAEPHPAPFRRRYDVWNMPRKVPQLLTPRNPVTQSPRRRTAIAETANRTV